jgi:beta-glucosidase
MAVPGPILTEWRDSVPSILCAFLPGEQYGNAIADLIFGNTVPQAKLPVTMPLTGNDQVRWPLMTLDWPRLTK